MPSAATFAVTSAGGAFFGDSALPEAALAGSGLAGDISGRVALGAPAAAPATGKVSVQIANLRGGPGTNYERLGRLPLGTTLTLLARHADWFQVRTPAGSAGWVAHEVISVAPGTVNAVAVATNIPGSPAALVATTTQASVNVRHGPGTGFASYGKLAAGTHLDLLGRSNGWFKVRTPRGTIGWVIADYLAMAGGVAERVPVAAAAEAPSVPVGVVRSSQTNLRGGPGTNYGSIAQLGAGTSLTLVARYSSWYKVQTARGTIGWVFGDLLSVSASVAQRVPVTSSIPAAPAAATYSQASTAGSGGRALAVRVALGQVGSRYRWGGASPGGFDCSGLTLYAYRQAGLYLPHKASAQFSTRYGARVSSMSALAPGDLVFFANTAGPGITHVALYVGGGRMVSAGTYATGVQNVSIWSSYWRSHYAGAIRPYV